MGFFSKKTTPVSESSGIKAAPKLAPVAITGVGVACHAGDQNYELISSILGQISGVEISDEYMFMSDVGADIVPKMAPVADLADLPATVRMYSLSATALNNVGAYAPANAGLLIVLMVDPELIMFNGAVDVAHFQAYLMEEVPNLAAATFRIQPSNSDSGAGALRTAIAELNEGKWHAVIFGGADSLISVDACRELHQDERLSCVGRSAGIVPGEGAAFVVLQTKDAAAKNSISALGYLNGFGTAPEPHASDADIEATAGLSTAITQALTQAGIAATDIQGIVHGLGAETVHAFEWYQTTQKIWPRRIDEQQRVAVQLGEIEQADLPDDPIPQIILPHMTMGELGAATLPMHIATALAWIEYDAHQSRWGFPTRKHLLVCDTPDAPERGALIISPISATAT